MMKSPNSIIKATMAIAGGTAAAQMLTVAALPFLTRLYSPEDFELLSVYLALLGILGTVSCLRYEIAIPLPQADDEGADLLLIALLSTTLVATSTMVVCLLWPTNIANYLDLPKLASYLWLLPCGIAMTGVYSSLQYWATRRRRFGQVGRSRLVQATVGIGAQISVGYAGLAPFGLLFGQMLYSGAGSFGLALSLWQRDSSAFRSVSWARLRKRAFEYRRFPTYSTVEALANSAAIGLPIVLISMFSQGPEAGYVFLASRIIGGPMQLVGSAISQVYLARAPEEYRAGQLRPFTIQIVRTLALYGMPSLTILALVAPDGFALAFGDQWRQAGVLLQWMAPWFMLQFLSSPVSMILHITGNQKKAMVLQIFGLVTRVGAVAAAGLLASQWISEVYAIASAIFYGVFFGIVISKEKEEDAH